MKLNRLAAGMMAACGSLGTVWGAVALDITKPPVLGPNSGPPIDPLATQGQWFTDGSTESSRPYEFYDNAPGQGGGFAGSLAINGVVTSITFAAPGPNQPITAFQVNASITNDLWPTPEPWLGGQNSHGEFLNTPAHYNGDMRGVRMTVEFALADLNLQPNQWLLPYNQIMPEIVANNEDLRAWYCTTDDLQNPGNYFVPAWDFGNIAPGQTATRILDFFINPATAGLGPADPRYGPLVTSFNDGFSDILMNRTTSLKISNWVDGIWVDNGFPYPEELGFNSNASVFFVPESTILPLLSLAGLLALRRRR